MAIDRQSVFAVNLINIMSFEERAKSVEMTFRHELPESIRATLATLATLTVAKR